MSRFYDKMRQVLQNEPFITKRGTTVVCLCNLIDKRFVFVCVAFKKTIECLIVLTSFESEKQHKIISASNSIRKLHNFKLLILTHLGKSKNVFIKIHSLLTVLVCFFPTGYM